MRKNYAKIVEQIGELEQDILSLQARRTEADDRVNQATAAIEGLKTDLQDSLVADDLKKAASLEKEIDKLSKKVIDRDKVLAHGLQKKIADLDRQLIGVKELKNKTFCKLAEKWLQNETLAYDSKAKDLIQRIKRMLVCHSALREIGSQEIYRQTLGQGYEHLPAARIPKLKGFSRQEFLSGSYHSGIELRDSVMKEITG